MRQVEDERYTCILDQDVKTVPPMFRALVARLDGEDFSLLGSAARAWDDITRSSANIDLAHPNS